MKLIKTLCLFWSLGLICIIAAGTPVHAAENLDIINEIAASDAHEDKQEDTDKDAEAEETVFLGDSIALTVPADWVETDVYEDDGLTSFQFERTDEDGRKLLFSGGVADGVVLGVTITSYAQLMEYLARGGVSHTPATINGIDMVLAGTFDFVCGLILDREGRCLGFGFELDSVYMSKVEESPELKADMMAIFRSVKVVGSGDLLSFDRSAPEFEPVSFHDEEFERMCRAYMGKKANDPVYPTELAAIRDLHIRTGQMDFLRKPGDAEEYSQTCDLDLTDLRLFPNLERLYICDMKCAGYEAITELKELRNLVLIRTGTTECGFLTGMTLRNLDLAGNKIGDFSPIASVKELQSLNLNGTGLKTLESIRGFDLTVLVASDNPIRDLSPVSDMKRLRKLSVNYTKVSSLEPLRNLQELEELDISNLKGEISLEPLQGLTKLESITCWETTVVDSEGLEDLLH